MNEYASHYPQPGPGYPPPAPAPQNGLGTAGFVVGLLGLLFSFIPVIGIIAWPMVLLGLVLAGVGISRARQGRATNKGLAIAGIVCSAVGLLICIVYASAFGAAVSDGARQPTAASAPANGIGPARPVPAQTVTAGIGDEVRDGSFAFVVTKVETGVEQLGKGILASEPQGAYTLVRVTVTNIGDEAQLFNGSTQKLIDAQGREFDADSGAAVMSVPDSESFLNNINPGNSVNGVVVFDLPKGVAPAAIELNDSMFSDSVRVSLTG
ncbi:DUF4352 domain-containing protein [Pseudonocardia sp. CA-142604]|uniref:DUF4352 domain-containing protein n=1 Tax=Pseudonocardia sp. CA-142604 TaxID=3240024 RepID=UPI003D8E125F